MLLDYTKLLRDDSNGKTALDTACAARDGILQGLKLPKQANLCISWDLDITAT